MSLPEAALRNEQARSVLERVEAHEPGQRAHAVRVAVYAVAAGERLHLDDEALANLRWAALLHDSGKLAVERSLLTRAGPLDPDEMAAVRTHSAAAAQVLAGLRFADAVVPIICGHHERLDGSGYPLGASGSAVGLASQLVGLAEAFDVTLFGASWRPGGGRSAARAWASSQAGTGFDAAAVDALLAVEPLIQPVGMP